MAATEGRINNQILEVLRVKFWVCNDEKHTYVPSLSVFSSLSFPVQVLTVQKNILITNQ